MGAKFAGKKEMYQFLWVLLWSQSDWDFLQVVSHSGKQIPATLVI